MEDAKISHGSVVSDHALKEVLRLRKSKRKSMSISTLPEECPAFCGFCQIRPRWSRGGQAGRADRAGLRQVRIDGRERVVNVVAESLENEDRDHGDQSQNQCVFDQALTRP